MKVYLVYTGDGLNSIWEDERSAQERARHENGVVGTSSVVPRYHGAPAGLHTLCTTMRSDKRLAWRVISLAWKIYSKITDRENLKRRFS